MARMLLPLLLWLIAHGFVSAGEVRFTVAEPAGIERRQWPVTSGIPLAAGTMTPALSQTAALYTSDGREVPLQTEVLSKWPDGSVRWLLLDFQVDLSAKESRDFTLRYGPDIRRAQVARPVDVSTVDGDAVIRTGPLQCRISSRQFRWLDDVRIDQNGDGVYSDDERVTVAGDAGLAIVASNGATFRADLSRADVLVEQQGPMRACVRVSGAHAAPDGTMFRYVVRIHAYRGRPFLRCNYTFINDWPAETMARIKSLTLTVAGGSGAMDQAVLNGHIVSSSRLFQVDADRYEIDGKSKEGSALGWAALYGERAGFAIGLSEFWQNWPKSIEVAKNRVVLGICPEFPANLYDGRPLLEESKLYYWLRGGEHAFKCGVARTHESWMLFFCDTDESSQVAANRRPGRARHVSVFERMRGGSVDDLKSFFAAAEQPLLATCDPEYVSETRAAGDFPPAGIRGCEAYDAWVERAFTAHLKRRERIGEYGMLNFGDWYGERGVNWGNLEYDLAHGLFMHYLRTGDRRYFRRAAEAARHHIDVDVVHAVNKHLANPWGEPPRVGDVWLHCVGHTGGYYSGAPLPVSRTYQVGHSTNFGHVWVSGDLDYYHLTGDRRAREVALEVADAMASHMPTRYGNHIRAVGWPMILVLDAYRATGDDKYLQAAAANWKVLREEIDWERGWVVRLAAGHCRHEDRRCRGNVPFMEGLTLCALARYHRVTGDPEVLRAISVGIDQMIRECWLEDAKTFRYTACPLSPVNYSGLFMLSAEAMAYEAALTGNREHLRILREGMRTAITHADHSGFGKSMAQMLFFAPHGLQVLPAAP